MAWGPKKASTEAECGGAMWEEEAYDDNDEVVDGLLDVVDDDGGTL